VNAAGGATVDQWLLMHEIVRAARVRLPRALWDYLIGGAETETTLRRNRRALDALAFKPRVLRDVSAVDCGARLLGERLRLPVVLAPIGALQDFEAGGGASAARAAHAFGVASMHSSATEPDLETIAAAAPGPKYYQLYVRGDAAWVDEQARRAADAGYALLCLTVDLDAYGRRERDLAKRFLPTTRRRAGGGDEFLARFAWDDVKRLQDTQATPLGLKGIACAEDAAIACEHGVALVYVSNHGGRQLDHGRAGIEVLPEVVAAVAGRAEVVVDGGFCRGTDIVKAMALGADAVGLGKLLGFAMAAAGAAGVVRMLEILEREVATALALLGVAGFEALDASCLCAAEPLGPAHATSAFPLLEEADY